jgi:arylsulfatase A-like enzyme
VTWVFAALAIVAAAAPGWAQPPTGPAASLPARNVIIFVADGLRRDSVNATDAPTFLAVRRQGVDFANSHAVFPTVTTPNAAAIATGHAPGDTGDFSNAQYLGFPIFDHGNFHQRPGTVVPFLEHDPILADIDDHFSSGNFLSEMSLLALARERGFNTATIGKLGPVAIQDAGQVRPVNGGFPEPQTIILDDSTGTVRGVPLSEGTGRALAGAGLALAPAPRGQPQGDVSTPGTLKPNTEQQQWFVDAATRAVLPAFAASGKPFVLVFWSRDPDGTQHNQGDSLNTVSPGINGPTSRAAVANADANLRQILDYLKEHPELAARTDVFVTSDHGFATISKHALDAQGHITQSYAAQLTYSRPGGELEVKKGWLPAGFLAIDLAHELHEPLFDPDTLLRSDGGARYEPVDPAQPPSSTSLQHPATGSALIGGTGAILAQTDARLIVAANGGSDLIYIPDHDGARARKVIEILTRQDYIGAIFADSSFGPIPGALPLSAIGLEGTAQTPRPAIVVSFKSFLKEPGRLLSAVQIADTPLQEGQGMHGSLTRDNTFNNMAALGPDFPRGLIDPLPVGNADIAPTLARILGITFPSRGTLQGRVLSEALSGEKEAAPHARHGTLVSTRAATGRATHLEYQEIAGHRYLDAAQFR